MKISKTPETEAGIQQTIYEGLPLLGYIVKFTGMPRKSAAGGNGNDIGVPDLLITHPRWGQYVWLGMEVKTSNGRLSKEQKHLFGLGRIAIARSWEDAWQIVQEFEEGLELGK